MILHNPCNICPVVELCASTQGCATWKAWFLAEWGKFNNYARAHGLEIEELKQDGNES